jgi:quercetin dioxygenase-like cupin family protein
MIRVAPQWAGFRRARQYNVQTNKEDHMRTLLLSAFVIGAAGLMVAVPVVRAQQPPPNKVTPYITSPLEGDPAREVKLQTVQVPPGGATPFHRHPGDQWEMIQEGEITFTIQGQEPKVLKVGDAVYIPRGTVHRNQNLTDKPARTVELVIIDKGKPPTEAVN